MPVLSRSIRRSFFKLALALVPIGILSSSPLPAGTPPVAPAIGKSISGPVADRVLFPEVRLRKLHLVRPDLIPYPIFYEIYC